MTGPDARTIERHNLSDTPNFGYLESWLARGGEPTPTGFRRLKERGFATVVNLRAEDDTERILVEALGMRPVAIPVADNTAPDDAQALQWLELCADAGARPLFVHCESGHGRTATFCILFRLAQGRKLARSVKEEIAYGFNPARERVQLSYLKSLRKRMKRGEVVLPAIV